MTAFEQLPDGSYTAVVDSIEDGLATVFVEQDGEDVGNAVLDATQLPEDGRHADAILDVTVVDGELTDATYDVATTERRADSAQSRFDRLSERPPSGKDT
jgi:hypothetical protein